MDAEHSTLDDILGTRPGRPSRIAGRPAEQPEVEPTEQDAEPDDAADYRGFHAVTKRLAPEQFELRSRSGNSRLVEYHTLLGADFHPSHGLVLGCVGQKILLTGKNLRPLLRDFRDHQVRWVQELDPTRLPGGAGPQDTIITSVSILDLRQGLVLSLDEAIAAEIAELTSTRK